MSEMSPTSRRPLTRQETRLLTAKVRSLQARSRRASLAALQLGAGIIALLWIVTLVASDAPPLVVSLFWLVAGGVILLWVRRDMRTHARNQDTMVRSFESSLRRNAADVYDVHARAFAEFEEVEDEGACYAFELEGERLLFISGQQFYPEAKFPSLDFSLVYVLDERDQTVDMFVDKRGPRAEPTRTISATVKEELDVPGHLETRVGRLDDLERQLRVTGRSSPS